MLIDPPTTFDTLQAWQEFLADMRKIKDPDDDVLRHIEQAEREIRTRQNPIE